MRFMLVVASLVWLTGCASGPRPTAAPTGAVVGPTVASLMTERGVMVRTDTYLLPTEEAPPVLVAPKLVRARVAADGREAYMLAVYWTGPGGVGELNGGIGIDEQDWSCTAAAISEVRAIVARAPQTTDEHHRFSSGGAQIILTARDGRWRFLDGIPWWNEYSIPPEEHLDVYGRILQSARQAADELRASP